MLKGTDRGAGWYLFAPGMERSHSGYLFVLQFDIMPMGVTRTPVESNGV